MILPLQPVDFLSPAQINLFNIYEKYLILIHRRSKWKRRLMIRNNSEETITTTGISESVRRRKRKVSQSKDDSDSPIQKNRNIHSKSKQGNQIHSYLCLVYI